MFKGNEENLKLHLTLITAIIMYSLDIFVLFAFHSTAMACTICVPSVYI